MIEFFQNNLWIMWMIAAGGFLVIEALTVGLVSIWFVPGAIIAAILSVWVKNFYIQLAVFLVISGITMFLSKKFFKKTKSEKLAESNDLLIGKTALAKTDISATDGKVIVGDVYWRAVSENQINEGEYVTVTAVNGNTLTVTKK
ncbi:MAG: NfeD family protein [Clostridia bacterium]|nr:NfeD family protein [Clostridia bacterium]